MREATSAAAATIAQLHLASVRMAYRGIVPDAVLDALTEHDRRVYWDSLLARRDGELYVVHVHTAAQRQGIGRAPMRAVATRLAADGIETLLVWVACANTLARRCYAALGARSSGGRCVHLRRAHSPRWHMGGAILPRFGALIAANFLIDSSQPLYRQHPCLRCLLNRG